MCVTQMYVSSHYAFCTIKIIYKNLHRILAQESPIFEKFEILTFYCQYIYIYSLILFMINNDHLFNSINMINGYKTRAHDNLYLPSVNLTTYSKSAYVAGIKAFSHEKF
jgi:hypothetical protein